MIDIKTMSILVVDDMKSMRLTIRKMLQTLKIGKTLRFAENGMDGLEILNNSRCDLAIIDWNMPVMNGTEMLDRIRNDKFHRDMPVIMVTAESQRDIVSEAAETEIDGYLLKPLTLAALDEKIKSVIDKVNYPDPATVYRLKAREYEEQQSYEAAIGEIKKALKHKPTASRLLRILGLLYFKIDKPQIGLKCLLKARSVNRQDVITRVHLAEYYIRRNELENAGKYFFEILSLSTRYTEWAMDFAVKLLEKRATSIALDIFSKLIVRSSKQNQIRDRVIEICLRYNQLEYCKLLIEQAIKENPSNFEMVYQSGVVYKETDDLEAALEKFIQVDRNVRSHIDAKLQIAEIYVDMGRVIQADEYLTQALRIDPKNQAALNLRKRL